MEIFHKKFLSPFLSHKCFEKFLTMREYIHTCNMYKTPTFGKVDVA